MPARARMRTVDERVVRAAAQTVFRIVADVERWPTYLRHYRYVRFRSHDGRGGGTVEMSANRPFGVAQWPTWWLSLMEVREGADPTVRFRHIGGITTHMEVEWSFRPAPDGRGTHVTVLHLWNGPSWPVIGGMAARAVIGPVFVHGIASRTLAGLAQVAERSQTSALA